MKSNDWIKQHDIINQTMIAIDIAWSIKLNESPTVPRYEISWDPAFRRKK
jgi:hypothetical protein